MNIIKTVAVATVFFSFLQFLHFILFIISQITSFGTPGYDIAFDKSRERIQKFADSSPKAAHYYSDAYSAYSEICYYGTHSALKNKSQTFTV